MQRFGAIWEAMNEIAMTRLPWFFNAEETPGPVEELDLTLPPQQPEGDDDLVVDPGEEEAGAGDDRVGTADGTSLFAAFIWFLLNLARRAELGDYGTRWYVFRYPFLFCLSSNADVTIPSFQLPQSPST